MMSFPKQMVSLTLEVGRWGEVGTSMRVCDVNVRYTPHHRAMCVTGSERGARTSVCDVSTAGECDSHCFLLKFRADILER